MKRERDEPEQGQEAAARDEQGSAVDEPTIQQPTKRAREEEERQDAPQPMEQVTEQVTAEGTEAVANTDNAMMADSNIEATAATAATAAAAAAATITITKPKRRKRKAPQVPSWMGAERFTTPPENRAEAVHRLSTVFRLARAANATVSPKSKDIWTCLGMPRGYEGRSQLWSLDTHQGVPLLCQAAQVNNVELVTWLLEEGGAVLRIAKPESPATHAAGAGALDVLRFLVEERDVPILSSNWHCESAVTRAARAGHADVVLYCFERLQETLPPPSFKRTCENALTAAVMAGHVGVVRAVLDHGTAQVHAVSPPHLGSGSTRKPLSSAAWAGQLDVVKYLVEERGVAANGVGPDGKHLGLSPLLCAATEGHLHVVKWLLEGREPTSASASETDGAGNNALMLAARRGREEVVRFLGDEGYCAVIEPKTSAVETKSSAFIEQIAGRYPAIAEYLRGLVDYLPPK